MEGVGVTGRITTVAVVDDHEIVSLALRPLIDASEDLVCVGAAATVEDLLRTGSVPDVVVLDARLRDGSSPVSNVERLNAAGAQVLIYTSGDDLYYLRLSAKSAALGVIAKSEHPDHLFAAIRRVGTDQQVMSTSLASAIDGDPGLPEANLSRQEQRVLELFASGLTQQSVATRLSLSVGTVDDYVRRIRAKYADVGRPAPDKISLYKRAVEDGYLPAPRRGD